MGNLTSRAEGLRMVSGMPPDHDLNVIITVTEEPLYINPFIRKVVEAIPSDIKRIYIVRGTVVRGKSIGEKIAYLVTLGVISGPLHLIKRAVTVGCFKLLNVAPYLKHKNPLSITATGNQFGIPITYVENIHAEEFLSDLKREKPTIIINQAQALLTEEFLSIPEIGCLNRHCALLPKYRGLLAPFWTYLNGEKESGVSIHFVDKEIDNGPILVQKRVNIQRFDTFDSILEKDFEQAPNAMLEAIELIREGIYSEQLIPNDKSAATYFSKPTVSDALRYRRVMLSRWLHG